MNSSLQETQFASPDRSDIVSINKSAALVEANRQLLEVIDAMPNLVAILDENRQIVGANQALVDLLGHGERTKVLGKRPGEALNCEHADENPAGCGTSEACQYCGAVLSILAAQEGSTNERECAIRLPGGVALDLKVKSSPFSLNGNQFVLWSAQNIEGEKRREVLERTFFHDIINSAGGLQGLAEMLKDAEDSDEIAELSGMFFKLSSELLEEIRAHRELIEAERGELQPTVESFNSRELLRDIMSLYQNHPEGEDRRILIDEGCADLEMLNARTLLFRVVGNMAKNALEATASGGAIILGCDRDGDHARYWVSNEACMPAEVQLQIFNRSFSTKGIGRGIGTYSMKMLTEQYLAGQMSFRSDDSGGTVFTARIPVRAES